MAAVTQRINNFLGGVSTQPDTKKLPGQVVKAKNVLPDPALGLSKRPGFKFLDALHDGSGTDYTTPAFANAKWFYINRDDDEVYIGCIVGAEDDTSTSPPTPAPLADKNIHIWNATPDSNGNYVKCTVTYPTTTKNAQTFDPRNYLNQTGPNNYQVLTVQDTTIVVNKKTEVTLDLPNTSGQLNTSDRGTIIIKVIEYSSTYSVTITPLGGSAQTASYQTYNADVFSNNAATDTKLNADTILTGLKTAIDNLSISGLTVTKGSNCLELNSNTEFNLSVDAGTTGIALQSFQDEVNTVADLPSVAMGGRRIKVVNANTSDNAYYAIFVANKGDGEISDGFWEETLAPNANDGFEPYSAPHELVNTAKNVFEFRQIAYTQRLIGDDETNSHPSFVGSTINGAFFSNNRLGFFSGDNVSMSQAGDFFNFYHITSSLSLANDPVDLSCSSIRPLELHAALPSTEGMLLFSQNQQFVMYSESGILSPQDTLINALSNYEIDKNIQPVEVGTAVYFVSKTAAWSRIFSYTLRGLQTPPQVLDIGKVVTHFIPSDMTHLIASPQNSFIALYGETNKEVYFYRFYDTGETQEMQSWFTWELPGYPLLMEVHEDVMYAVIQAGSKYMMCTLNVSSTPDEAIVTSSEGEPVNPFMDFYADAAAVTSYNGGSKIQLPYDDITGLDPVILVKGTANFSTITQSGYTAPVSKEVISGTTYFVLPGIDLSSQASDVVVGYKYALDVTLPTIHYQQNQEGTRTDYADYLVLNRVKFSVGQTSFFGLKLKSKGVHGNSFTFTGDGSTTSFSLPFTPSDRRDIVVYIDGFVETDFTITDAGVITFATAPGNNKPILAYEEYVFLEGNAVDANDYLSNDVAIEDQAIYTFPINQRNSNVEIRIFNNAPFPITLSSMVWEGQVSQRYIRRV